MQNAIGKKGMPAYALPVALYELPLDNSTWLPAAFDLPSHPLFQDARDRFNRCVFLR